MKNRSAWIHLGIAAVLATIFWTTAYFLPNWLVLLVTNSLVLIASAAVGFAYIPVAWATIWLEESTSDQRIAIGIAYSWFFGALWRILSLLWITSGQDPVLVNNDVIAFFQAGIFLGAVYHLISPGAIGGPKGERLPSLKWIALGCVVGIAVALAVMLAVLSPDTRGLVEQIKPYIPR